MREYFALIFRKPCGGFVVEFPDLPDCVTFANSHESARTAAAEALAEHIKELARSHQAIPKPSPYEVLRRDPRNNGRDIIRVEVAPAVKRLRAGIRGRLRHMARASSSPFPSFLTLA